MELEKCPRCGSLEFLKKKLILIGKYRDESNRKDLEGGPNMLYSDRIRETELKPGPLESFIDGLYCTKCDIGFVPDNKLKEI